MTIVYKHFKPLRTALYTAFILIFMPVALAWAADPLFTIENVKVDVTADNAIMAREKAFEQAQINAFEELSVRMLPNNEQATTKTPDPLTISTMIQDFELINEQLSAVRYIGTYTFRFNDRAVRRHFGGNKNTYSDVSSKPLLVLPFFNKSGQSMLWSPYNAWMEAWKRQEQNESQNNAPIPLRLPIGDLDDVQNIEETQALSYNPSSLNAMLGRYGATEAVIAIASPDAALGRIYNINQPAEGRLSIEIFRTDRGRPEMVGQVTVTADGIMTKNQVYDQGVHRVKNALNQDWKSRTAVKSARQNTLPTVIPIRTLDDWIAMQSSLKRVQGIEGVTLKSLTSKQANIDLNYQGDVQRLILSLQQSGLTIERMKDANGNISNVLRQSRYKSMRF